MTLYIRTAHTYEPVLWTVMGCSWPMPHGTYIMILRISNNTTEICNWNQAGKNNSIILSNTTWPHQLLVRIPLLGRAYFNSHIRHSRAGRALLRWRKECGRLWVQLASAVQAPIAYMFIDSCQFLPVTSSVIVTCTYPFTADDNQLQKWAILSSAMS